MESTLLVYQIRCFLRTPHSYSSSRFPPCLQHEKNRENVEPIIVKRLIGVRSSLSSTADMFEISE